MYVDKMGVCPRAFIAASVHTFLLSMTIIFPTVSSVILFDHETNELFSFFTAN